MECANIETFKIKLKTILFNKFATNTCFFQSVFRLEIVMPS